MQAVFHAHILMGHVTTKSLWLPWKSIKKDAGISSTPPVVAYASENASFGVSWSKNRKNSEGIMSRQSHFDCHENI